MARTKARFDQNDNPLLRRAHTSYLIFTLVNRRLLEAYAQRKSNNATNRISPKPEGKNPWPVFTMKAERPPETRKKPLSDVSHENWEEVIIFGIADWKRHKGAQDNGG